MSGSSRIKDFIEKFAKQRIMWHRRMANLDFIIDREISLNEASIIKEILGLLVYAQRTKEWIIVDNLAKEYFESIRDYHRKVLLDRCELVIEKLEDVMETQDTLSQSIISKSHVYETLECEKFFSKTKVFHSECEDFKEEIISSFLDISISNWDLTNVLISKMIHLETKATFIECCNNVILHSLKLSLNDPGMLVLIQSLIS